MYNMCESSCPTEANLVNAQIAVIDTYKAQGYVLGYVRTRF